MGRVFSLHFEGKIPFRFGEVIDFCYLCTYLPLVYIRTRIFFVTACDDGICLGKYDHTRGIIVHRTFVSVDMLKEKHLLAYEKIEGSVTLALEVRNKYGLYSEEFQKFQAEIPEKISLSTDEAQRIYASYYGKDDDE